MASAKAITEARDAAVEVIMRWCVGGAYTQTQVCNEIQRVLNVALSCTLPFPCPPGHHFVDLNKMVDDALAEGFRRQDWGTERFKESIRALVRLATGRERRGFTCGTPCEEKNSMDRERNNKKVKGQKPSPGPAIIEGLTELHDALQNGARLSERFTVRTVELQIAEPPEYDADEVRRVRERLRASQGIFAKLLGVSIKTIQAWEQGNPPSPMARRLLDSINKHPQQWEQMLREAAGVS